MDLHIHTLASDGEITPWEILECAKDINLEKISITDHDALGGYKNFGGDPVKKAKEMGITLVTGIELDSEYEEVEVHVLGYGIDIQNKELNDYLANIQGLRRQRIREQIQQINALLNEELLHVDEIFINTRDTVMKPHLIRPMINKGLFPEYRPAAKWVAQNTNPAVDIPKPTTADMIGLIKRTGGRAFIAHPGYYIAESGINIDAMVKDLLPAGLDGLEVYYPYFNTSPKFKTKKNENDMISLLAEEAKKHNLDASRGSDAHTIPQIRAFSGS